MGLNLVLCARTLFVLQGLSVSAGVLDRAGVGLGGRILALAALAALDALTLAVSFIGLLDFWVNFRRLPRDGVTPAAPTPVGGRLTYNDQNCRPDGTSRPATEGVTMKVILLQELKGRGGEGDVIDVAQGFAVNYLLPRKVAIEATKGNLKQLEQRSHNIQVREEGRLGESSALADKLDGKVVTVEAKVGEEGRLFGSVTTRHIERGHRRAARRRDRPPQDRDPRRTSRTSVRTSSTSRSTATSRPSSRSTSLPRATSPRKCP